MKHHSTLQKSFNYTFVDLCFFSIIIKPSFMFDNNNNFKSFELDTLKTIYPFWLVTTVISSLIYLFLIVKKGEFV